MADINENILNYILDIRGYKDTIESLTDKYEYVIDKYYITSCRSRLVDGFLDTSECLINNNECSIFYTSDKYIMLIDSIENNFLSRYRTYTIMEVDSEEFDKIMESTESKVFLFESRKKGLVVYTYINDDQTLNLIKRGM